jgi:DNA repair protein SbcD/Mre11
MQEDTEQNTAEEQANIEKETRDGSRQGHIVTIVLTADNHLGHTALTSNPHKRQYGRQCLRRAFQQVTDFAIGQGVDLFIQAGDLFDTTNPDEEDRSFVAERLSQLKQAGIRTFAISGFHDTPIEAHVPQNADESTPHALAPQISYARLGALHYFQPGGNTPLANGRQDGSAARGSYLQPVLIDMQGTLVGICGFGVYPGQGQDPLAHMRVDSDIERADIPILIVHAPLEAIKASIASQTIFRYILAGCHPGHQQLHIGQSEVIVAGATQRINFNDPDDDPGFVFLGLAADGIRWCRHIAVDTLRLRRLVINTAELWPQDFDDTVHTITESILQRLEPLCNKDTLVQLRLVGELTRSQYHQLDLNQVRHYGEKHCFALAIDDSHLSFSTITSSLPGEEAGSAVLEERLSPREELIALADEWIAAAQDEQERHALQVTKEELLAALSFRFA